MIARSQTRVSFWTVTLYPHGLSDDCSEETHRIVDHPYADNGFVRAELSGGGYVAYRQESVRKWETRPEGTE